MTANQRRGGQSETHKERVDRELIELLNELRVVLPGVQVLFAFLLILPFSTGFGKLEDLERSAYLACLLTTALTIALLVTPTSFHRLHFRAGNKERMLFTSNKLAIAGMGLLAVSIALGLFVVISAVSGRSFAFAASGVMLVVALGLWYAFPLSRHPERDDGEADG